MQPTFRDLMIWMACTGIKDRKAVHTIEPFVQYLHADGPLTPYLRNRLIALLREGREQSFVLKYRCRRRGPKAKPRADEVAVDLQVIRDCTTGRTDIAPLIQYLEAGGEFTPALRTWLSTLMSGGAKEPYHLDFEQRQGHHARYSMEEWMWRDMIATRVNDLRNTIVTHQFRWQLEADFDLASAEPIEISDRQIYRLGAGAVEDEDVFVDEHIISLEIGAPLSQKQAEIIVARELGTSVSTVKRILAAYEEAEKLNDPSANT